MANKALLASSKDILFRAIFGQRCANGRCAKDVRSSLDSSVGSVTWQRLSEAQPLRSFCRNVNEKLNILALLFARQCNGIATQKVRRAVQIVSLYRRLGYDGQTVQKVVEKLGRNFLRSRKDQPLYFLFGAALFAWNEQKFTEDDIKGCVNEIQSLPGKTEKDLPREKFGSGTWEKVIDRSHLVVWRNPVPNTSLYEYKVFGTFYDIPARAFYNVQKDLEYRKQWDKLIIKLGVVDSDDASGSEVVQWVMHYPRPPVQSDRTLGWSLWTGGRCSQYPMYSREYIYLRKTIVDPDAKVMLLMSHAVEHPQFPQNPKYVRVSTYKSNMVIKPHNNFDDNGFDYILTYYDDPQAAFPTPAYNWMASTGVPDFVDKMHVAAKKMHEVRSPSRCSTGDYMRDRDSERIAM